MSGFIGSLLGLHLIRPMWLAALPLALLLPWLWARARRPAGDWSRVCDPHLLRWLGSAKTAGRQRRSGYVLAALAITVGIVALAGPSWSRLPDASFSAAGARVIALDLSRSMLATDLRPDRLTRARYRLRDLLRTTREGQVGLVAYAGDAYVVSPLTSDTNTIANMLPALQPDIMPVAGSRADRALQMAAGLLARSGHRGGEILLVTDEATSRDAATARKLRDKGIATSVLAVGTTDGAPIPSGSGFVSDHSGNVVVARLDRSALRDVAVAGGGRYSELGSRGEPWRAPEQAAFERRDDALGERWKDAGPWLVLLLLPLALAGFRRGLFFVLPLILLQGLTLPGEALALEWSDLWQRRDQQAWEALRQQDAEKAAALARDPALSGEAWYRSKAWDKAAEAWSQLETPDALYNRANALALEGDYEAAIETYDRALAADPKLEDAQYNRAIVEQMKKQQEKQEQQQQKDQQQNQQQGQGSSEQEQQGRQQDSQDDSGEQQDGEQAESADQQQQGEQRDKESPDEGEPQNPYREAWSEEDAQSMEQWLRRIPDDPGGLLRRKFRSQHQRRGAPQDEATTW